MSAAEARAETSLGLLCGSSAFLIWGLLPIYYHQLGGVAPVEILANRVFWSLPVLIALAAALAKWSEIKRLVRSPKSLGVLALTTCLISINWGLFIWAISSGRILDASLGYFINPLMSVAIGAVMLGEKIRTAQKVAIGLACVAVLVELISLGRFPWVSLVLSTSFAAYGYLRKTINADAVSGHFIEIAFIAPLGLAYIFILQNGGTGHLTDGSLTGLLLAGAGPLTVLPLILFTMGARRLNLSTVGLLQYMAPTIQLFVGILYGEAFTPTRAVAFGLIWVGLAIFSIDAWRSDRAQRLAMGPMAAQPDAN